MTLPKRQIPDCLRTRRRANVRVVDHVGHTVMQFTGSAKPSSVRIFSDEYQADWVRRSRAGESMMNRRPTNRAYKSPNLAAPVRAHFGTFHPGRGLSNATHIAWCTASVE